MKLLLALVIFGAVTVIAPWSVVFVTVMLLLSRGLGRRLHQNQPPAMKITAASNLVVRPGEALAQRFARIG